MAVRFLVAFLAVPIAELLGWYACYSDFSSPFPTSYGIVSVLIALAVLFWHLHLERPFRFAPRRIVLFLNGVFLSVFFWITASFHSMERMMGQVSAFAMWYVLAGLIFFTGFFTFVGFQDFIERISGKRYELVCSILAAGVLPMYDLLRGLIWPYLSRPTQLAVYYLLRVLGFQMSLPSDSYHLRHADFEINIGSPCSGLEGIALFWFCLFLILIMDRRMMGLWRKIFFLFWLGAVYMFLLNVVRISLIFGTAAWATAHWGASHQMTDMLVWTFHSHVGWVIYLIGIGLFFAATLRFLFGPKGGCLTRTGSLTC